MRCGQVSPLGLSAMSAMARMGSNAISEMAKAAADQPRLPLSLRRLSFRRKVGAAAVRSAMGFFLAALDAAVPASLASFRHQGGDRLGREVLIGLLQRIGEGIGGVDYGIDQV